MSDLQINDLIKDLISGNVVNSSKGTFLGTAGGKGSYHITLLADGTKAVEITLPLLYNTQQAALEVEVKNLLSSRPESINITGRAGSAYILPVGTDIGNSANVVRDAVIDLEKSTGVNVSMKGDLGMLSHSKSELSAFEKYVSNRFEAYKAAMSWGAPTPPNASTWEKILYSQQPSAQLIKGGLGILPVIAAVVPDVVHDIQNGRPDTAATRIISARASVVVGGACGTAAATAAAPVLAAPPPAGELAYMAVIAGAAWACSKTVDNANEQVTLGLSNNLPVEVKEMVRQTAVSNGYDPDIAAETANQIHSSLNGSDLSP